MSGETGFLLRSRSEKASKLRFASAAVCVALFACGAPSETDATASSSSPLIGGSLSVSADDAVVFLRGYPSNNTFSDCSGTLLSPSVLITAKHCVSEVVVGKFICSGAGALIADGTGAGQFGAKLDPTRLEVYVGAQPSGEPAAHGRAIFSSESADACHDDVAAVVLDSALPLAFPALRSARATVVGENVRVLGYGLGDHPNAFERREIPDVRVIDVAKSDSLDDANATTPRRTFAIAGGTACFGDSGGPALSMSSGALVGVYSRITGDCFATESRNTFMQAARFADLFARAFELAGEAPTLEPGPEPQPGSGSAGAPAVPAPEQEGRHDAFRCSVAVVGGASSSSFGASALFGLALGWLTRRRRAKSLF